jgi:hypothetical protein
MLDTGKILVEGVFFDPWLRRDVDGNAAALRALAGHINGRGNSRVLTDLLFRGGVPSHLVRHRAIHS